MKPYQLLIIAIVLFAINSEIAVGETSPVGIGKPNLGEEHFRRYCASCHGLAGKGDGPAAGALKAKAPDLTQLATRRGGKFDDAEIASFIDGRAEVSAHGTREMPVWGEVFASAAGGGSIGDEFSRGKVQVLLEYLKSIQK